MFLTNHDDGSASAQSAIEETTSVESLVKKRFGPGMLVLAPPVRVIHMNQAAWDLVQRIRGEHQGQGHGNPGSAEGLLPAPLRLLCPEVMKHLHERPHAKDWESLKIKRLIGLSSGHPILVRAFGIPDSGQVERSRVVLPIIPCTLLDCSNLSNSEQTAICLLGILPFTRLRRKPRLSSRGAPHSSSV